jgi:ribonuclease HI
VSHGTGALITVHVDGAPAPTPGAPAGLGVVVRRGRSGPVLRTASLRAPAATNNEAEYQALIAGMRLALRHFPGRPARFLTDSRVVVDQLTGRASVRANALRPLHAEAAALARDFAAVEFVAVPRLANRLADALAWEALYGRRAAGRARVGPGGDVEPTQEQED